MLKCEAVEPDGKSCRRCGEYKPLDAFLASAKGKYSLRSECKSCMARRSRDHHLRAKYGLSANELATMVQEQAGTCPLCGTSLRTGTGNHAVDHCHVTGKVRAVLCGNCNMGLGHFKDNPAVLRLAARYVEMHRAST